MTFSVKPFSLKDAPALIERLLPVQKLSAEAYKEQMSNHGKTLTALGSYWKGRKPLILNKACILGCLLPATDNPVQDLAIFEKLMAMDDESFVARLKRTIRPKEILENLYIACITDYFTVEPKSILPISSPIDWSMPEYNQVEISWRMDIDLMERRRLEAQLLPHTNYRDLVEQVYRPEEVSETVHAHIWSAVNTHLGTHAKSFPDLIEQLGIMRYGHRPSIADTFCGSGQIPFEAARLGCDVYASDLNPVACMLTWGAFNIVGASSASRAEFKKQQQILFQNVHSELDSLEIETDGNGWRAKTFLYCFEVRCPQTGWLVPLIPSLMISRGKRVIAQLVPDLTRKRYEIRIVFNATQKQLESAARGTISREGRFGDAYLLHKVDGYIYKTKISTLRGDYQRQDGTIGNKLRLWDRHDFKSRPDDIFQERLYAIHWMRPKRHAKGFDYEFRSINNDDLERERKVDDFIAKHLADWQAKGWLPDMRIEPGGPPRYEGLNLIRGRGWTYWHHLFNPRQLLVNGLIAKHANTAGLRLGASQAANWNSKLSTWDGSPGVDTTHQTFYNQAINTFFTYGTRSTFALVKPVTPDYKSYPIDKQRVRVECKSSNELSGQFDLFITDPPYGDAVKYEEILDFFIAWLRTNVPIEFAKWTWDSRRSLAIKGEDEDFRRGMVSAYKRMTECMSENGMQVVMFTHQSGSIWADMANIVWASGLQVTAAWYVVTETDSFVREGTFIKGTVLLILRRRQGTQKITRDDLAWEIQEEVQKQIEALAGLNQDAKNLHRDENVFEDADIQMAGYAAALRVLTRYAVIDGRDMTTEASRPRVIGEITFVDGLIAFAVDTANQCLVPKGILKCHWDRLIGTERFYIKMLDLESRGAKTLDNYQNFAKAFKVRDFKHLLSSLKANDARLKSAVEFGRADMGVGSELHQSVLRAVLYAVMELVKDVDGKDVLAHLRKV